MQKILKKAEELGKLIAESEAVVAAARTKEAYENDKAVQQAIFEYNAQNAALSAEYRKETHDEDIMKAIKDRIGVLYNQITENPSYMAYVAAEEQVAKLMKQVNEEINFQVTGERSEACTGNCGSCGGCH